MILSSSLHRTPSETWCQTRTHAPVESHWRRTRTPRSCRKSRTPHLLVFSLRTMSGPSPDQRPPRQINQNTQASPFFYAKHETMSGPSPDQHQKQINKRIKNMRQESPADQRKRAEQRSRTSSASREHSPATPRHRKSGRGVEQLQRLHLIVQNVMHVHLRQANHVLQDEKWTWRTLERLKQIHR